jgi:hypothetical protein
MDRSSSLTWVGGLVLLAAVLTGCGSGRGGESAGEARSGNGPVVPVVTSVVGMSPSGTNTTSSVPSTTQAVRAGPTATAAPNYGESPNAITLPTTPQPAVDAAVEPAVKATADSFLQRFWSPAARTSAQVANDIAPFATERLLATYRDPAVADKAVPGAGVSAITVQITAANATTATALGRGTLAAAPGQVANRTLTLVAGPDGVWRVDRVA